MTDDRSPPARPEPVEHRGNRAVRPLAARRPPYMMSFSRTTRGSEVEAVARRSSWRSGRIGRSAVVVASVLALAACTSTTTAPSTTTQPSGTTSIGGASDGEGLQRDFVSIVNTVRPSVVEIATSSGLGSGVIYNSRGDIVTNAHVVGSATTFRVVLYDGHTLAGTLVGIYAPDDLAVIKVSSSNLPVPAKFGNSSRLLVGDIVLAMGSPLGLQSSVTDGIVSFNGRTVSEGNGVVLPSTVQTSAAINPGNSGGALVDLAGEVVGIPTLAATDQQSGTVLPGIGFAIASNTVKLIADQLVATGHVTHSGRAALGIEGATATTAAGESVGVIIASILPGGAAEKAGLRTGDVITEVGQTPTPTLAALQDVLAGLQPGDRTTVRFTHSDGTEETVTVTLGELTSS